MSNDFPTPEEVAYQNPFLREMLPVGPDYRNLVLTPWTVQNIAYELAANYMLTNGAQDEGYVFSQKYDRDPRKSEIHLDISYNYKDSVVQKRPAVFVGRGDVTYKYPTLNQQIGGNSRESIKNKLAIVEMPITVTVVGTNIGFAEQFAYYLSSAFIDHAEEIRNDFALRAFRLDQLSQPSLYLESKEHFSVTMNITTVFDQGYIIKGDHLKLKTVAFTVFTGILNSPLLNQ